MQIEFKAQKCTQMNPREILELMPKRRLLRSQSVEFYFKLDNSGKPTIDEILTKNLIDLSVEKENLDDTLTLIDDPTERANAYKDICKQLKQIISAEREENLANLEVQVEKYQKLADENSTLRTVNNSQNSTIENLEELTKNLNEQLSNNKALLEETNSKFHKARELLKQCENVLEIEELNKKIIELNKIIDELKEEIEQEKLTNELLKIPEKTNFEEKIVELNSKIKSLEKELNNSLQKNEQLDADYQQQIINLEKEIEDRNQLISDSTQNQNGQNIDPINANFPKSLKMELQAKDIIIAIPSFTGDMKQFDGFLNTCGLYYDMVTNDQKPFVLKIIKAKISGEALLKAGPFDDTIDDWNKLKKKLKEHLKKPVSLEYAMEDLNNSFQKSDESIEDFGSRIKTKLRKLNQASRTMTDSDAEKKVVAKMHEKQAISKFEQNLRNQNVKILVSAAQKTSLDECITFAMQKELIEKNKNIKNCNYCGLQNHEENNCRKKMRESQANQSPKKNKNNGGNFRPQNSNKQPSGNNTGQNQAGNNGQKSQSNRFSPSKSSNYETRKGYEPREGTKNLSPKNVKALQQEEQDEDEREDEMTVREALESDDEQKN